MPQAEARGRRGFWRWILLAYVVLLLASRIVRFGPEQVHPSPDQTVLELPAFKGDQPVDGSRVQLAFRDRPAAPGISESAAPIVILHGSPVASSAMRALEQDIARSGRRTLTPDLPGFGGSSISIPDYSIRAHGAYVAAWLDSLGVSKAHLVGYSMGGGVALEAYRADPERIASISMVSAIGVQELELTGDYHLNRAVHAAQLAGLLAIRELVPHFGYLDDAILGVSYGRNFFDTDQRPLRGILRRLESPMLIVHGEDDFLVPVAAAREHYRLVPQSTLKLFEEGEGGHGLVFVQPAAVATLVTDFVTRVEAGLEPTRAMALPERVAESKRTLGPGDFPRPGAFSTTILVMMVGIASFISEDLATIGAGLMAARGTFTFLIAVLAALLGIVVGDVGLYLAGRWVGRPVVRRAPFKWFVKESDLDRGAEWFERRGFRAILLSRFVPGTRAPTYVTAGIIRAPFPTFLGYFLLAAALWTPLLVGIAMLAGQRVLAYYELFESYALVVLAALVLMLLVSTRIVPLLFSHTGRRRLHGRWQRLRRWEFGRPWVFYAPLLVWWLWLSIRHRSFTAFTAANPGMPDGGFIGESKASILKSLADDAVASWILLDGAPEDKLNQLRRFADKAGWPVVLKPDVGERGRGVTIAENETDADEALSSGGAFIAQRYVPGVEFGVFYARRPSESKGRIISVTDKRFPSVRGDGQKTLQELILDDSRAVMMADFHLAAHAHRLNDIPEPGEVVRLVDLGTHCRGALFLDGDAMATDALTARIHDIAAACPGFYFGRFDIRGADPERIAAGEGFEVIELNGVTSESTHIYHPGTPLHQAYRTLFRQWSLAYEIGLENMAKGHRPSSVATLIRALLERIQGD